MKMWSGRFRQPPDLAFERWHFDLAAERRDCERDRHRADDVIALALEERMLFDLEDELEIARPRRLLWGERFGEAIGDGVGVAFDPGRRAGGSVRRCNDLNAHATSTTRAGD